MTFAATMKNIRENLGLSQQSFADTIGVSFSTVNRWENGRHVPNKMTMKVISSFCKGRDIEFPDIENSDHKVELREL